MTAKHIWRISRYGEEEPIFITADTLSVHSDGTLVFSSIHERDMLTGKETVHTTHIEPGNSWSAVTECDDNGTPVWIVDMERDEPEESVEIIDADLDVLKALIEELVGSAIRKAVDG